MFRSLLAAPRSQRLITPFKTTATSATQIIGPLWTGCGSRKRSTASQMMTAPMATSVRAFARAARMPTR